MKLDIRKQHCTAFCQYGVKRSGVFDSIEVHSIGCAQNTASAIRNNMNQSSPSGIVHAIVDAEVEGLVLEILPDNNVAWADAGKGNRCSFTFEISESDYMRYTSGANYVVTDSAKFKADIMRGYKTAVYYTAYKCKQFGFNPLEKTSDGLYRVYSHREAHLKGLASNHADPSHIWEPLGLSMDGFRQDVKKVMDGGEIDVVTTSTSSTSMSYFVRKSWEDKSSQLGAYSLIDNAKKICDANNGYYVFDANGKVIYPIENATLKPNTTTTTTSVPDYLAHKSVLTGTTDKIWMGWLKRESGSRGYRCTNGDSGHAQGAFQLDNRYALVPFMQYCVDKFPTHYDGFKKYIAYGVGSSSLVGNTSLASLWTSYCDNYWDEFCSLQDSYAYKYYYLEAKKYINNLYGINMDTKSPVVKGTLWSMAIRSGSLTGARKFEGCNNSTSDEEMLRIAYSKYGTEDANRWTQANQYGDALAALKNNEYMEIVVEGTNTTAPSTPTQTTQTTTPSYYYVRKSWADKSSQLGAYTVLDNAITKAKQNPSYCVFDSTGKQIYPEPKTTSTQPTTTSDRYVVATSCTNNTFANKHNTFNVLANAQKDADNALAATNKTYYVFDTQDSNKIIYTSKQKSLQVKMIEMAHEFQSILEADHKVGKYFTYQNSGYKSTIDESRNANRTTNCVILVNWLLKKLGVVTSGLLNHKYDGTIGYTLSKNAKTEVPQHFDFITMKGKLSDLINQGKIYPGDIIFFYDHMNMNIDGTTALDGGRGNVKGACVGGRFNTWVGKDPSLNKTVGLVVRSKGAVKNPYGTTTTTQTTQTTTTQTSYKIKVTATSLNVRKEPNTSSSIVTTIPNGGVYTIVEEKDGWGKLLSGVGWISLSYTTKV